MRHVQEVYVVNNEGARTLFSVLFIIAVLFLVGSYFYSLFVPPKGDLAHPVPATHSHAAAATKQDEQRRREQAFQEQIDAQRKERLNRVAEDEAARKARQQQATQEIQAQMDALSRERLSHVQQAQGSVATTTP